MSYLWLGKQHILNIIALLVTLENDTFKRTWIQTMIRDIYKNKCYSSHTVNMKNLFVQTLANDVLHVTQIWLS